MCKTFGSHLKDHRDTASLFSLLLSLPQFSSSFAITSDNTTSMGASISSRSSRTGIRTINEANPIAAASSSTLHNIDGFKLLDLPEDVLYLILRFLNSESLTTLRSTCKVLDAVTFDRFADQYFAHMQCWTFTADTLTRLKDIIQDSPRLRGRIRKVTLTDNFLEDKSLGDLHLVPKQSQSDHWAQHWSVEAYIDTCDDTQLGLILAHRVFLDLQRLPQEITIALDFINRELFGKERYHRARQEIFFSLITSQTKIHSLADEHSTLRRLDDILAHNRIGFLDCMSTLQTLRSTLHWHASKLPENNDHPMFAEILSGAKQLRDLTFEITMNRDEEVCYQRNCPLLAVPSDILLGGTYSNLTNLKLVHFAVSRNVLEHVIQQFNVTLTHLTLRRVRLTTGDDGWKRIGEILLTASKLAYVQLQMMYASDDPYHPPEKTYKTYGCPKIEDGNPPGFTIRKRDNILRGLEKLSQLGASIFEQQDWPERPCCGNTTRS
jgi:hypothetical protein